MRKRESKFWTGYNNTEFCEHDAYSGIKIQKIFINLDDEVSLEIVKLYLCYCFLLIYFYWQFAIPFACRNLLSLSFKGWQRTCDSFGVTGIGGDSGISVIRVDGPPDST